jgi:[ribosomal protein S18]-alanine N-acetyltransferase
MHYSFAPITEEQAREMASWQYEGPYAFYNPDPEEFEADVAGYLDPQNAYYAITGDSGEMLGFCCFGPDARVPDGPYDEDLLDVGMGMRPDLTGKGGGHDAIMAVLDFARDKLKPKGFRATVAAFNNRALKLCQGAGFHEVARFSYDTGKGEQQFVLLARDA